MRKWHASLRNLAPLIAGVLAAVHVLAAPVTISTEVIIGPGVPHVTSDGAYYLAASEPLTITGAGILRTPFDTRGWAIQLDGTVANLGSILSGFGSETFGLYLNGNVENRNYIEASTLAVGGTLINWSVATLPPVPTLVTGAHRTATSPGPLTVIDTFQASPQQGFSIGPGGMIENRANWVSYAHGSVYGLLDNSGSFESKNNTVTFPSPVFGYAQTIEVGDFGSTRGAIHNRETGSFVLYFGSLLQLNNGTLDNQGTLTVKNGAEIRYAGMSNAANHGTGIIEMYGHLQMNAGATFVNHGQFLANAGGTVLNNGSVFQNGPDLGGSSGTAVVEAGATFQQGAGSTFDNQAGGTLIVRGSFTGGNVSNSGEVQVASGATMEVNSLTQMDGLLVVNGTLTSTSGTVTLHGGRLEGSGIINASTFWRGVAGVVPQAQPFCFLTGYACLRPGNSPGHLEVNGDLDFGDASVLELEIARNGQGDLIWDTVTADNIIFGQGSVIEVVLGAGVGDLDGRTLQFLTCRKNCTFGDATVSVLGGEGQLRWEPNGLMFTAAPVPEPESWALMLAGLGVLASFANRKRAASI